jgi:predicted transcriptional regulator of viral defense system
MQSEPHTQKERKAGEQRAEHRERERRIGELAERQHGIVSLEQLRAHGVGDGAIKARLRLGQLHRVHRGVYSVRRRRLTRHGAWLAAVLACGDGAVLSHRSAAALWGLMRARWSPVDVTSRHGRPGERKGIRLHRSSLGERERAVEAGIPVTSVARTLLDIAEVVDGERLRHAFEEADRLKLLRLPELERVCAGAGRRKGLPALRGLVSAAQAPPPGRSPLENRFAEFYRRHLADLPEPLANVSILGYEVDAYWPSHRLMIEMDSWEHHSHRAAFEHDRARDIAMQAAGYRVVHLTHRQLESEAPRIARQLRNLLAPDHPPASGKGKGSYTN